MKTATKERPILFSGDMVRAILDGSKTQTRRAIKPQPPLGCYYKINQNGDKACCLFDAPKMPGGVGFCPPRPTSKDHLLKCPYGKPGDRLWVRESFEPLEFSDTHVGVVYDADPIEGFEKRNKTHWYYVGEDEAYKWTIRSGRKYPSIHMPRWASRIDLEVKKVHVERLHDITETAAIDEGAPRMGNPDYDPKDPCEDSEFSHFAGFYHLWLKINGEESWAANPWVWVVEFERIGQ